VVKIPARSDDARDMSLAAVRPQPYPVRIHQRRCGKCGKLVSRTAYACRRCGKAQRMRPRTIMLLLSAALMGGMFAVATISAMSPGRAAEAPPPPAATAPAAALAVVARTPALARSISATELWSAYTRDHATADRLYRDRSVVISGIVRAVDRDFEGGIIVRLATPDPFEAVNATLATRNDPALGSLVKGRPVSLQCVGRGELIGAPLLAGCFVK